MKLAGHRVRAAVVGLAALAMLLAGNLGSAQAVPVNVALATNTANAPTLEATHVNTYASPPSVLNDGASGAGARNWNTWGENSGSALTISWPNLVEVDAATVWLWTDAQPWCTTGCGAVKLPRAVTVQYLDFDTSEWRPVTFPAGQPAVPAGIAGTMNYKMDFAFEKVTTGKIRIAYTNDNAGIGSTEVLVFGENTDTPSEPPAPIDPGQESPYVDLEQVELRTTPGVLPELPATVWVLHEATAQRAGEGLPPLESGIAVTWDTSGLQASDYDAVGDVAKLPGVLAGSGSQIEATVTVAAAPLSEEITDIDNVSTLTTPGLAPAMPATVTATYADGTRASGVAASWSAAAAEDYAQSDGMGFLDATVAGKLFEGYGVFFVVAPSAADAPPVIAVDFVEGTLAPSGWFTSMPAIELAARRGVSDSAITTLDYCLTDCDANSWTAYTGPIQMDEEGEFSLHVRAVDDGERAATKEVAVRIDTLKPRTTATHSLEGNDAVVELSATDTFSGRAGSGVARTVWSSGPSKNPDSSDNVMWGTYNPAERIQLQLDPERVTYVHYRSEDAAGNLELARTLELPKGTAPSLSVTASTSGRCVAGKVVLVYNLANQGTAPVEFKVASPFGGKTVTVAPGKSSSATLSTRQAQLEAGALTVSASGTVDGKTIDEQPAASYGALSCS